MNALDLKEERGRTRAVLPSLGGELIQGSDVPVLDTSKTVVLVSNTRVQPTSFDGLTTSYTDVPAVLPAIEPLYAWDKHVGWAPADAVNNGYQFKDSLVLPVGVDVMPMLRYSELTPAVKHAEHTVASDKTLLYRPENRLSTPNQTVSFDVDAAGVVGDMFDIGMLYDAAALGLVEIDLVFKLLATGKTYNSSRISYDWDARLDIDVDGTRSEIFSKEGKITMERKGGYDTNYIEYPITYKPASDNLLLHGTFHIYGSSYYSQKASAEVHLVGVHFL